MESRPGIFCGSTKCALYMNHCMNTPFNYLNWSFFLSNSRIVISTQKRSEPAPIYLQLFKKDESNKAGFFVEVIWGPTVSNAGPFDKFTCIIGPNGSGKSNIMVRFRVVSVGVSVESPDRQKLIVNWFWIKTYHIEMLFLSLFFFPPKDEDSFRESHSQTAFRF